MTFFTLLPPYVARFNIDKALYEIRIENKGDLPSEKSISRNALLIMMLAIFLVPTFVQLSSDFYILFTSQPKYQH